MIGTILNDKYEILSALTESHQFEIFTALELETGSKVVIKILREEMCASRDRMQIFCDEIRAFAGLSHPSIVHILDMDTFEERPYVVTELIDGRDLKTWVQTETTTFKDVARVIQEVAGVLQYAHDQKIALRSIKTSNIFRTANGATKVLSFSHPRLKLVSADSRTPDESSGIQSDLFFLGSTLYELLSGESIIRKRGGILDLWESRLRQALRVRHPHLSPEIIEKVVDFVDRNLTRNFKQRFESHSAFLIGLSDLIHLSDGALRKARQFTTKAADPGPATASDVVDAIQGKFSNAGSFSRRCGAGSEVASGSGVSSSRRGASSGEVASGCGVSSSRRGASSGKVDSGREVILGSGVASSRRGASSGKVDSGREVILGSGVASDLGIGSSRVGRSKTGVEGGPCGSAGVNPRKQQAQRLAKQSSCAGAGSMLARAGFSAGFSAGKSAGLATGSAALAEAPASGELSLDDDSDNLYNPYNPDKAGDSGNSASSEKAIGKRPRLTLVKGGANTATTATTGTATASSSSSSSSQSMMWRKVDENAIWWRSPLIVMGGLLAFMVLLILFW